MPCPYERALPQSYLLPVTKKTRLCLRAQRSGLVVNLSNYAIQFIIALPVAAKSSFQ